MTMACVPEPPGSRMEHGRRDADAKVRLGVVWRARMHGAITHATRTEVSACARRRLDSGATYLIVRDYGQLVFAPADARVHEERRLF